MVLSPFPFLIYLTTLSLLNRCHTQIFLRLYIILYYIILCCVILYYIIYIHGTYIYIYYHTYVMYIHTVFISMQVHRPSTFRASQVEFLQQRQSQNVLV